MNRGMWLFTTRQTTKQVCHSVEDVSGDFQAFMITKQLYICILFIQFISYRQLNFLLNTGTTVKLDRHELKNVATRLLRKHISSSWGIWRKLLFCETATTSAELNRKDNKEWKFKTLECNNSSFFPSSQGEPLWNLQWEKPQRLCYSCKRENPQRLCASSKMSRLSVGLRQGKPQPKLNCSMGHLNRNHHET